MYIHVLARVGLGVANREVLPPILLRYKKRRRCSGPGLLNKEKLQQQARYDPEEYSSPGCPKTLCKKSLCKCSILTGSRTNDEMECVHPTVAFGPDTVPCTPTVLLGELASNIAQNAWLCLPLPGVLCTSWVALGLTTSWNLCNRLHRPTVVLIITRILRGQPATS
jgi:hypothetical protein